MDFKKEFRNQAKYIRSLASRLPVKPTPPSFGRWGVDAAPNVFLASLASGIPASTELASTVIRTTAAPRPTEAARLLPRQVASTLGFYNAGIFGGTTSWASYGCGSGYFITTSENYFKCCPAAGPCEIFTGCSNNYIVSGYTSTNCQSGQFAYCTSDLLFSSLNAQTASTWFYCAQNGAVGTNVYVETTSGSPEISTTMSNSTSTQTPAPAPSKSTPIGPIIGGVLGGVFILIVVVFAILYMLTSKSKSKAEKNRQSAVSNWSSTQQTLSVDMKYGPGYQHSRQMSYELGGTSKNIHELETRAVPAELDGETPQLHNVPEHDDRYDA